MAPLIVAHRGASGYAPENTFAAFDRAVALGFPDIELDVHASRDGVPVVLHDADLGRTTDGSGRATELPFTALLGLDAGRWFAPEFAGQRVPALEQVFARYVAQARFTVEIKQAEAGLEAKVLALLARYGLRGGAAIASFEPAVLRDLEPVAGSMPLIFNVPVLTREAIVETLRLRASCVAAPIDTLTDEAVEEAADRGLQVGAWGVATRADAERAVALELDRIYCDRPDEVAGWLGVQPQQVGA